MSLGDVDAACQANLDAILSRAFELGVRHVETARMYGSSELQLGRALKKFPRDAYILQTKIIPMDDMAAFRATLDASLNDKLQVERVDLLSLHGVNTHRQLEMATRPGGCLDVLEEYRRAGRIGHIGFSTHGMTDVILDAINTGRFDYVNLHYHFLGSYTASGGPHGGGNRAAVAAAQAHDMGVFIISPADKGGKLYKPSLKFSAACLPDATPLAFGNLWLWAQDPPCHTAVVGVARPEDLDEHYAAAMLYDRRKEISDRVAARLQKMAVEALGKEWLDTWWQGLPGPYEENTKGIAVGQMVWYWNLLQAYGMYDFCRDRFATHENVAASWDPAKTFQANCDALYSLHFMPGNAWTGDLPQAALADALRGSPHADKVLEILCQVRDWLCKESIESQKEWRAARGWAAAYDLQADLPFPERVPMPEQVARKAREDKRAAEAEAAAAGGSAVPLLVGGAALGAAAVGVALMRAHRR